MFWIWAATICVAKPFTGPSAFCTASLLDSTSIRGLTSRPQAFTNSRAEPLQIGVAAGALIIGRGIDLGPFHRMRVVPDQEFKDPAFRLGQAAQARVRATLIRMATALTPSELGAAAAYFAKKTGRRGPPAPPPRHRRP
jgi:hypothetical protein